jgi:acyl-CoA thioesterase-1
VRPAIRYVALGDSYTIGTSVDASERWPSLLVTRLAPTVPVRIVANLGANGATSADVLARQVPRLGVLRPGFATVLIGVNDIIRSVTEEAFRRNVGAILDALLSHLPPTRILAVATPDYTVTPEGASYGDPASRSAAIVRFNLVVASLAAARRVSFVDILDLSRAAAANLSLVADDGLHPSGSQYALWVERIAPAVEQLLAG